MRFRITIEDNRVVEATVQASSAEEARKLVEENGIPFDAKSIESNWRVVAVEIY